MEPIALIPVPLADLQAALSDAVKTALNEYQSTVTPAPANPEPETYLTRKQVSVMLGVSLPTLHNMTRTGKLTGYRFNHSVRYKLSEVESAGKVICPDNQKPR